MNALEIARERLATCDIQIGEASDTLNSHESIHAAFLAWHTSVARLGRVPVVPDLADEPTPPEGERPTATDLADARTVIRLAGESTGARRVAEEGVSTARAAKVAADATAKTATAEAARVRSLVDAIRKAPGIIAAGQVEALGDTGALGIEFPVATDLDANPPAIRLTWDGRPIEIASTGERLLAGLALRIAIRRTARLPLLYIAVDSAQDANGGAGPWPDEPRILYCVTTGTGALTATPGRPSVGS